MPWGVAAGLVGGALISSQGAQSAADTQAAAQEQAANTQMQMYNSTRGQEQPFLQSGQGAAVGLNDLLGIQTTIPGTPGTYIPGRRGEPGGFENGTASKTLNPTNFGGLQAGFFNRGYRNFSGLNNFSFNPANLSKMPGYNFQLTQGDRAIQSSNAATNGALSGAAFKDLMSFNQGLAGTYENQYFNQALSSQQQNWNQALQGYQTNQGNYYTNQQNIFNRLSQIASLGQNAAGNLGSTGAQLGTGVAQAQAAAGASQAAGTVGVANAYSNAAQSIPMYQLLSGGNVNQGNNTTFQQEQPIDFGNSGPINTGNG